MPISFVGSKTFTHAATSAQSCSLTDLLDTSGASASLQQGDLVVVTYVHAMATTASRTLAQCTPAGYTNAHATIIQANDSNAVSMAVSYKFMGATPDTSVSIPAAAATTNGVAVIIEAYRGVHSTTPLDVTTTTASGTNTGVANPPSITPVTAGSWIVGCAGAAVAAGAVFTNTGSPGYSTATNHFRSATITSTTNDANAAMGIKTDWASGAFDAAALGGSTSTNTGSWGAASLALRQAPTTHVGSAALDGSGTLAAAGAVIRSGAAAVSGSGALTAAATVIKLVSAALSGAGTLLAAARATFKGTAAVSGSGTFSAIGRGILAGAVVAGGSGNFSAAGAVTRNAAAAFSAASDLVVASQRTASGAATLSGTGSVSATGNVAGSGTTHSGAADFSGMGTLSASGSTGAITVPPSRTSYAEPVPRTSSDGPIRTTIADDAGWTSYAPPRQ